MFLTTEIINHWKHLSRLVLYSSITDNFQIKIGLVFGKMFFASSKSDCRKVHLLVPDTA